MISVVIPPYPTKAMMGRVGYKQIEMLLGGPDHNSFPIART
jgi:hypothetical protein